ncbi:MAG: hypothetical protein AAGJ87_06175 [Pseudomonadota bacterium]
MTPLPEHAEHFLKGLNAQLVRLPVRERVEIVRETRAHLIDRQLQSRDALNDALDSFGPPEAYAAYFIFEETHAFNPVKPKVASSIRIVLSMATGLFAAVAAGLTISEVFLPANTGFFLSESGMRLGVFEASLVADDVDVLGPWFVIVGVFVSVACAAAMRLSKTERSA